MTYVVAGGSGYLGSHLVGALAARGEEVLVVDRAPPRAGVPHMVRDLREPLDLDVREPRIYHLAASPIVRATSEEARRRVEEELRITVNVAELARLRDAELLVYVSSPAVYGNAPTPTPEDAPRRPISHHGLIKAMSEDVVEFYSRVYGIRGLIVRLTNVVGGAMTHGVVLDFVRKLRSNPGELEVYGDGTQGRSFLYVDDAIAALEALEGSGAEGVYNAGNSDWITVREVAEIVSSAMGLRPALRFNRCVMDIKDALGSEGWPGDIRLVFPDSSRLRSLGWSPRMDSRAAVARAVGDLLGGR
ncbi:MAG: NAD-dependent epimerase/dehydratase family protein [Nitrososphaeria archaeon]